MTLPQHFLIQGNNGHIPEVSHSDGGIPPLILLIPSPVHSKHHHFMIPMECGNSRKNKKNKKKLGFAQGVFSMNGGWDYFFKLIGELCGHIMEQLYDHIDAMECIKHALNILLHSFSVISHSMPNLIGKTRRITPFSPIPKDEASKIQVNRVLGCLHRKYMIRHIYIQMI